MKRKFTFLIAAALMLLTMMAQPGRAWGQTTVTQTSFSAISGNVNNDSNVSYTAYKGEGTSNPAVNSNAIRLYQNSAGKTGGYVVIGVADGYQITSATIRSTMATTTGYLLTDTDPGATTPDKSTFNVSNYSLSANTDYTVDDIATRYITFACFGTSSSSRLYLSKISITYESTSGGNTPSLSVNPASLNFGNKAMNPDEPYYETFTVTYAYLTENLTINVGSGLTGVSVSPQEISKDGDGSQIVTVYYNPTTEGEISGNITVSNTEDELSKTVAVSGSSYDPANVDTYELYTDEIVEGDYVIYNTYGALLNELNNGPRFKNQEVNISDDVITNPSDAVVWHIAPSGDYWTIYNAAINKYAGGTQSGNQGALLGEANEHAQWSIYYQYSILYIENYGRSQDASSPNNRYLRQNSSNASYGWATYASGTGLAPKLYKKVGATTYKVTYNANGATDGTVPVDNTQYNENDVVTVADNTGNLVKAGYVWAGWCMNAEGTGTVYGPDYTTTFEISANTTLYAKWDAKTITTLTYSGTPTATQYAGQAFNPAGLTVTATFNDESQEDVTSQVVWTPNPLTIETTSVTGTYMEQTVNVEGITVTYAPGTENNPYTVAEAMAATPTSGTSANVYIHGIVSAFYNTSIVGDGSNYRYYISDDGTTTSQLLVYKGKGLNNVAFSNADDLMVGDIVVIYGGLTTYQNAPEIASGNYLYSWERPAVDVEAPTFSVAAGGYAETQTVAITCATEGAQIYYTNDGSDPTNESFLYDEEIDIEETTTIKAIAYVGENASTVSTAAYYILSNENTYTVTQALEFETYPQNNIFVEGIVSTAPTSLLDGGLLTYYISVDGTETNRLQVYKGKNLGNTEFTAQDNIQVGDRVTIFGNVKTYNEIKEFDQGNYLVTWERLETVATPTFTPEEGEYAEAQSVTIACATEGATIYYKTAENAEWAVYSEAINVTETTTIWAYAAKEGMNNSAVATATYTINIPVITASITVEPALVEATAEGGDGTLTVTYENITEIIAEVYFCDAEGEAASYDWITAEINNENNVEYLIVENDGEARTAYFKVWALDDEAEDVYSDLVIINQAAYVGPSQEVTDVLNNSFTGVTGTTYSAWTNTGTSGAVYAGNSAGGNDAIQLRSNNSNSGIVTTTSGGKVTKVEVTWNGNTSSGRKIDIYGKNTAYEAASDLYGDNQGTKLGTIEYDNNTALIITDDYEFIGIRSNSGALYLDEIQITWSTGSSTEPSITVADATVEVPAEGEDNGILALTYANLTITEQGDFDIQYYDENGDELGKDDQPDWMEASIQAASPEGYEVSYSVSTNDSDARTAYFKVWALDDNADEVYSNLVTINQAEAVATATITVAGGDANIDVDAEGVENASLTLTYTNLTITDPADFDIQYYDGDGNELGKDDQPDWMEASIQAASPEGYEVSYSVSTNDSDARTAYFKVYKTESEIYSNLVTVTQAGYVPPVVAEDYKLFSGDLVEGDYLIVYDGVAMNYTLSGKRFGYDEVTISNNTISNSSNSIVWHIAPSATEGYWTLFNVEEEKYASNGGTSMDMSLSTTSDNDNTLWSVTAPGETTHEFRNKSNESQSARYLRRNTTYGFACYSTSTGGALSLYKKVDNTPTISFNGPSANIGTYPTGEEISYDNIIVSQHNLTESISLSADKGTVTPNSIVADAEPTQVVWSYTPEEAGYTTATITATSGTVEATFVIQFVAKTPHNINIASVENGTIAVVGGKTTEIEGENVDFTVTPDEGYVIDEITVMAGENPVDYIQGETFYRFQMPDSDVTISATFTETVTDDYELFSGDLVEGDYLIVYDGVAMNYTLSGKRFGYDEVTISNNTISNSSNSIVWHIAPSATEGYWTLFNVEEEKYASNGGTSMDMSLSTTSDNDNTLWSVTAPGETTHEFRNKSNESQSARYLRRNTTYGFACYSTSTGGALSLYKKVDNTPTISFNGPSANIGTYPTGEEISYDNIIVSQHNLTESISLSADKGTVTPNSIVADAEPTQVVWSYTPEEAGYTTATITATSGTVEATFVIQFVAKTPHNINIASVENGTIAVVGGKTTEIEGENVDFTVTPDEGYVIDEITVMAGENPVDYIQGETFYRFQMPDSDVTISATFNALPKYTIKFYVNGNQDEALTISDIVEGNSTPLPTASTLTPAGFSIAGWAESGSTIAVADPYTPTDNVDLYALFQLDNAQTTSGNYVKVTEELTDWSGEYLIVYEDGNVAFDGSLTTLDANGNTIAVTLTNNTIEATTTTNASKFTIVTVSGGYSILSASGYFIGQTTNENGLSSSTTEAFVNTISYDTENNCVNVISSGGAYLRYNSDASRFRYYKSSSYTGQKAIQLYKKESTSFNNVIVLDNTDPEQEWTEPIPESTCVVVPNNVTLTYTGPNPSTPEVLVVQEGGQLIHTTDVEATVQKGVSGYTNKSGDGWYLISSPVDNLPTSAVATGTYDLFAYDEATAYWWVDHAIPGQPANHTFTTLERGKGYLYANAANVNLNYAGTMKATNANIKVDLSYACDEYPYLKGFNLVGNPFTRNITATDMVIGGNNVTSYYDFNADRTEFVTYQTNERPIQPGQGFFIQATGNAQQLEFNPATSKDASDFQYISISAGDENFTDKAYIQFGYGNTLRKMTFGENTMVYVMNNDDDYAAARVEELAGTIPVHFVPIADGFYTITVETKNIENLNYMHLIDNIKNTEIDLLVEPSYTFKASESDNADRFYLVFDFNNYTGVNENYTNDNFAHQIGDEIFVSGEGTLQVFDVLGRFVTGYNVNGDKRISTAEFNTGVYIFRMVGTEVKTQKIIVR